MGRVGVTIQKGERLGDKGEEGKKESTYVALEREGLVDEMILVEILDHLSKTSTLKKRVKFLFFKTKKFCFGFLF